MKTYFDYLCDEVGVETAKERRLCKILHDICISPEEYDVIDETREEDIDELRAKFCSVYGEGLFEDEIEDILDGFPTVLEFLTVLAIKIEDKVMSNPIYGDRTAKWFWIMIENLEISPENVFEENYKIDSQYIREVCERWLSGEFDRNGVGSPFPLRNAPEDVRDVGIWRHAMWYFNENFEGRW